MNIALTTQETLGLMKDLAAKNVPDDYASQKLGASGRAPQPRRRSALAFNLRHDRFRL